MIIVLLLFFKSICLYCQRLVLHIHDRWINPKNVRLIREAAEAKGVKFLAEDYRQSKKSKKRRYAYHGSSAAASSPSTAPSPVLSSLGAAESCRFCANTPQGYCRHHFHLQELQVHKQQQQRIWCPLAGGFSSRSVEYKQLRKIKRELKKTLHQQQQQQRHSTASYSFGGSYDDANTVPSPIYQAHSSNSYDDSGYQTISLDNSKEEPELEQEANEEEQKQEHLNPHQQQQHMLHLSSTQFLDLPTPNSVVETTYSFESCYESSSNILHASPSHSFISCESSSQSTPYV